MLLPTHIGLTLTRVYAKIIPHSLRTLLAASDLIVAEDPRTRGCASCGETPRVGLSRCARCEQVYYCGRVRLACPVLSCPVNVYENELTLLLLL